MVFAAFLKPNTFLSIARVLLKRRNVRNFRNMAWTHASSFVLQNFGMTTRMSSEVDWKLAAVNMIQTWALHTFKSMQPRRMEMGSVSWRTSEATRFLPRYWNYLLHHLYHPSSLQSCFLRSDKHLRWAILRAEVKLPFSASRAWTVSTRERATPASRLRAHTWQQNRSRTERRADINSNAASVHRRVGWLACYATGPGQKWGVHNSHPISKKTLPLYLDSCKPQGGQENVSIQKISTSGRFCILNSPDVWDVYVCEDSHQLAVYLEAQTRAGWHSNERCVHTITFFCFHSYCIRPTCQCKVFRVWKSANSCFSVLMCKTNAIINQLRVQLELSASRR